MRSTFRRQKVIRRPVVKFGSSKNISFQRNEETGVKLALISGNSLVSLVSQETCGVASQLYLYRPFLPLLQQGPLEQSGRSP